MKFKFNVGDLAVYNRPDEDNNYYGEWGGKAEGLTIRIEERYFDSGGRETYSAFIHNIEDLPGTNYPQVVDVSSLTPLTQE